MAHLQSRYPDFRPLCELVQKALFTIVAARQGSKQTTSTQVATKFKAFIRRGLSKEARISSFVKLVHSLKLSQYEQFLLASCLVLELKPQLKSILASLRANSALNSLSQELYRELYQLNFPKDKPFDDESASLIEAGLLYVQRQDLGFGISYDYQLTQLALLRLGLCNSLNLSSYSHCLPLHTELKAHDIGILQDESKLVISDLQRHLNAEENEEKGLAILLIGPVGSGKRSFATLLAKNIERPIYQVRLRTFEQAPEHLADLLRSIFYLKELVFIEDLDKVPSALLEELCRLLSKRSGLVILSATEESEIEPQLSKHVSYSLHFQQPDFQRSQALWKAHLSQKQLWISKEELLELQRHFNFSPAQIEKSVALATSRISSEDRQKDDFSYYQTLLKAAMAIEDNMRSKIMKQQAHASAKRSRLILRDEDLQVIDNIISAITRHEDLLHNWGFAEHYSSGKGIVVLFDGPPGTGKSFCCEVIANAVKQPLQMVQMAQVVSKWIGETGKNIQALFEQAKNKRAILMLDEADALLSKRIENVSRASDRYANMDVNILLQEIERFDGVILMTTNLESSLDEAIQRRIQYRLSFKKPGAKEREALWRSHIPNKCRCKSNINWRALAEDFELTGAQIKNAVYAAAQYACEAERSICLQDLQKAAEAELVKSGALVRDNRTEER